MSSAINLNSRGLRNLENIEDTGEEKDIQESIGFLDSLDLMDFKDDLKYK